MINLETSLQNLNVSIQHSQTKNELRKLSEFSLRIGGMETHPIIVGGMGVDISSPELALAVCNLGGIGHISDAMSPFVSDQRYGTSFSKTKSELYRDTVSGFDKTKVKFTLEDLRQAQFNHIGRTMDQKKGSGAIFVNVMEKLNMADPLETLKVRMHAVMDAGIDGITLSAGLHQHSLKLVEDNPRFRDVKIGIIVSSDRALKIFLRGAARVNRMPDYIVVEGPLAGGHLGFGPDWQQYTLSSIVSDVVRFLKEEELDIPVIAAGGVFTGTDAVEMIGLGAAGVQVATRFTITEECGLPRKVKHEYLRAKEEDVVVNSSSPTGYLMRMLSYSPSLRSNIKPNCEPFGYILNKEGKCQYLDAYQAAPVDANGKKLPISDKMCICYHFSKFNCYTCGHYVYRLKDTTVQNSDGSYQLLTAEHVFNDYLYSTEHSVKLPKAA